MNEQISLAESILILLVTKRDNKREELEAQSRPTLDRVAGIDYRKFQTEVEYWQLKNTVDEIVRLAAAAGVTLTSASVQSDAVKNQPEAAGPAATQNLIPAP